MVPSHRSSTYTEPLADPLAARRRRLLSAPSLTRAPSVLLLAALGCADRSCVDVDVEKTATLSRLAAARRPHRFYLSLLQPPLPYSDLTAVSVNRFLVLRFLPVRVSFYDII